MEHTIIAAVCLLVGFVVGIMAGVELSRYMYGK